MSLACAVFAACTGDEAVLISGGSDDAGAPDGRGAGDAPPSVGSPGDGGPDGSSASCGARDTTPCNCGPSKSCCPGAGGGFACFERGTEDQDAGCTSTATLRCAATGCGANRVCCFNGAVTPGTVCPKRMTRYDTECIDVVGGGFPCVDTTNGLTKVLMCLDDADCAPFDAGTCVSALMDEFRRVMGICAR